MVGALGAKQNNAIKKLFPKWSIRLRSDDLMSQKSLYKYFNKLHFTLHFLGHFKLNSNLKNILKELKIV